MSSKKYDQTTYETGVKILGERASIIRYIRGACYVIFASLVLSLLALSISLISDKLQVCGMLKGLFGACVATLVWGGLLLAILVHKAAKRDSLECRRTIDDLKDLQKAKS